MHQPSLGGQPPCEPRGASLLAGTRSINRQISVCQERVARCCRCDRGPPTSIEHQDYTLRRSSAGTPRLRRSRAASKLLALCFSRVSFFRAQLICFVLFFNGAIRADSRGFCGRTRSSHIFRFDDGVWRARVEMGVVLWRSLAFSGARRRHELHLP